MPDPAGLIATGRLLIAPGALPPSDAQCRRAVSTAYDALFHALLRAAADRFMGPGQQGRPGYGLLYRGFQHGRMRRVSQELIASPLRPALQRQLGRATIGPEVRQVASAFVQLQDARHAADYDPAAVFAPVNAESLLLKAELAIAAFAQVPPEEQADLLALMLLDPRT